MRSLQLKVILMMAIFMVIFSSVAAATSINYDFTAGNITGQPNGNTITASNGGVSATITAWGLTGTGGTTFQPAQLSQYSGAGLGVCSQLEGLGCAPPNHQIDNTGNYDFVEFQFSNFVSPLSFSIQPFTNWDRDVTYYTGNAASPLNLNGLSLASLASLGLVQSNDDSTVSNSSRTITFSGSPINTIIIGGRVGGDASADMFKIQTMDLNTSAVPEPATMVLIGIGFLLFGFLGQRQATQARQ